MDMTEEEAETYASYPSYADYLERRKITGEWLHKQKPIKIKKHSRQSVSIFRYEIIRKAVKDSTFIITGKITAQSSTIITNMGFPGGKIWQRKQRGYGEDQGFLQVSPTGGCFLLCVIDSTKLYGLISTAMPDNPRPGHRACQDTAPCGRAGCSPPSPESATEAAF